MPTKNVQSRKVNLAKGKQAHKPKLLKFRLVAGMHKHGNYTWLASKSHVIATELPLDKMFRNKFERVPDETPASPGILNYRLVAEGMEEPYEIPQGAKHYGDISPEDESDTEEVAEATDAPAEEQEDQLTQETEMPEEVAEGQFKFLQDAVDVTGRFPKVTEDTNGTLRVLQQGSKFGVVSEDNPRELLNKKPLRKNEVASFVEAFLEG